MDGELLSTFKITALTQKQQKGKRILIEIAKLAAQQDGRGTSENIRNYGIDARTAEGQTALIEIAKLAAQQNGRGTSECIENYCIHSELELIEIAKFVNIKNCLSLLCIKNFKFNEEINKQIILLAFLSAKEEEVALLLDEINKPGFEQNRSQLFDLINSLTSHVPQFQKILLGKNIESSPQEVLMELDASNKMHHCFQALFGLCSRSL